MFSSEAWLANPGANFYNGVIGQSLRLSVGSNYKLDRQMVTPTSVTGTICTASWWMKKSAHGTVQSFIQCRDNQASGNYNAYWSYDSGFGANDHHAFFNEVDSINVGTNTTVMPYRDPSGWYHVVIRYDSTQSTASDRIRIYKNGTLQNSTFTTTTYPSQNAVNTFWNNAGEHLILFGNGEDSGDSFDGYIAEVNWVDGLSLAPESFGELKNGVWIPVEYTGSYGLNGSRYTFSDSSDIGADSSGVGNHLDRVSNLSASDVVPDSPENNFCTLNSVGRRYGHSYSGTFSEGNLKFASSGNSSMAFGTMAINQIASQGGVYFEIRLDSQDTSRTYVGLVGDDGANNKNSNSNGASYSFPIKALLRPSAPDGSMGAYFGTSTSVSMDLSSHNSNYSNGDVVGVAILSDGKTFFHKNGTYLDDSSGNVGNPSTGANPIGTIDLTLGDWVAHVGYNSTFSINFGQDGTFSGQETSGGNQDGNGIGDFMFAVPTNCFAICSSNMAEPTIGPNSGTNEQSDDYFTTYLWTGNGSNPRAFTDVGFQADWIWVKKRSGSGTNHHLLADSARGDGKTMLGNEPNQETTNDANGTVSDTTTSGGFTVNAGSTSAEMVNDNNDTYVAWLWKANGGTATATISESGDNPAAVVQANPKAGFSIITYTGTGDAGTIAHGLGAVPTWMLIKNRDQNDSWAVYHGGNTSAPATQYLKLDTNAVTADKSGWWDDTAPTLSVFTVHDQHMVNANGENYVAYVFADVEGFSKMGSYISNQNTDGTFIYLGFRPKFVIVKRTNATYYWMMYDSERDTSNVMNTTLFANESNLESASDLIDFVSNGIKLRTTGNSFNGGAGSTFIYMAWAEMPFKYSLAR